ncbi:MAG: GerW family sporulation protein [Oscillospiraceae bacterium]|nr:GerW family sporulation protein [Oscillospiraceae bacterium]
MADNLKGLLSSSMEKIRDLVDVNAIIGDPITSPDGTLIIPISKVTFGFVSGGSDIPAKSTNDVFAGGAGAGVTIKPQAFIVIKTDGDVKLLEVGADNGFIDGLITGVPDLINKVKDIFGKNKEEE